MRALRNPGLAGRFGFDTVVYASSGLNYSAVPALNQYQVYDSPDPDYVTGRIDISAFANLGTAPWPFGSTNVPRNGHVCVPHGRGPFPIALFAHGNHFPLESSTPGYLYLCELLASHGIIAGTIDVNFLNGGNFGENDARAIVHLEHVKQFRTWNGVPQHPLQQKVDLNTRSSPTQRTYTASSTGRTGQSRVRRRSPGGSLHLETVAAVAEAHHLDVGVVDVQLVRAAVDRHPQVVVRGRPAA